jgi:hypothetical protein
MIYQWWLELLRKLLRLKASIEHILADTSLLPIELRFVRRRSRLNCCLTVDRSIYSEIKYQSVTRWHLPRGVTHCANLLGSNLT